MFLILKEMRKDPFKAGILIFKTFSIQFQGNSPLFVLIASAGITALCDLLTKKSQPFLH